jgi:hypothetical protein
MRRLATAVLALGLAACATPGRQSPRPGAEEEEAFVLMVDAGRMQVFTDRIGEAAGLLDSTPTAAETDLVRAAHNLRQATLAFFAAKEAACAEGKFVAQSCARLAPPAWLAEAPTQQVSARLLRRRIEEVQAMMQPLLDVACETGRQKSKNELFCSVE